MEPEIGFHDDRPDFHWSVFDICQQQAEFLIESEQCHDEDEAFSQACADADLISFEWSWMTEALGERLKAMNPDGYWYAEVKNFGWRQQSGYKHFEADDGQSFLREILPETDCTFRVYVLNDEILIQNSDHDSPVGNEWYTVTRDESVYEEVA